MTGPSTATRPNYRGPIWGVVVALLLVALVIGARVVVSIYQMAHPRDITVWCDPSSDPDKGYNRSYEGPADLVLGACQMVAGTNNP